MKPKLSLRFLSKSIIYPLVGLMIFGSVSPALAASLSTLQKQKQQAAAQAAAARKKTQEKQAQANQLRIELEKLSGQIAHAQKMLDETNNRLRNTENKINDLNSKIRVEEDNLARERQKMSEVVSSWYMEGQSDLTEAVVRSDNISDAVDKNEAYDSVRGRIENIQNQINQAKANLDQQKAEQENQLQMLENMKNDQESQKRNLAINQAMKNRLLNDTVNTLAALRSQEQSAQARIGQINNQIGSLSTTRSWGNGMISSIDPGWYYTQLGDYTRLGNSPYNVNQYGCLITSMAMVATYYGHRVTPSEIASNDYLFDESGYLQVSSPPQLGVSVMPSRNIDWNVIDGELAAGRPIIVGILIPSVGSINNDGSSHYVVIKGKAGGKYLMHDPLGDGRSYDTSLVRSMKLVRP